MYHTVPSVSEPSFLRQGPFKFLVSLAVWVAYVCLFVMLVPYIKEPTGILVFIPVVTSSWLWGMRIGGTAGLIGGLANFILYSPTGILRDTPWLILLPNFIVFGMGLLVGYLQDLRQKLKQQNTLIKFHADHDALTGLYNRAAFNREVSKLLLQPDVSRRLCLLYIDLDNFKMVNDTLGHTAGDALLVAVAKRLCSTVRSSDICARLGGDEFALVLPDLSSPQEADLLVAKILSSFARPFVISDAEIQMQASIGISLFPDHGTTLEELLTKADKAMYDRKMHGKNGIQAVFS